MLSWFAPKSPVTPEEQAWIERRAGWIVEQFGQRRLRECPVVLPTPEFFPDPYEGRAEDAAAMFHRICRYMDVDPQRVELSFYSDVEKERRERMRIDGKHQGAAGLYLNGEQQRVAVERSNSKQPLSLAATLAHELGHVLLLGDGRISSDEEDHEPLTDLLTVFMGMGIFTANATLRFVQWQDAAASGWKIGRLGYLSQPMFAYAHALFAWVRGERSPGWAKHLRPDVRAPFNTALRFVFAKKGIHLPEPD